MNEMNNGENNFNNENQNNDNYQQQPVNNVQLEQSVNNQEPPKKEEKKSYCGLLIVFMVISLLLAGFIVYDKVINKEKPAEPAKQEEKNNGENNKENANKVVVEVVDAYNSKDEVLVVPKLTGESENISKFNQKLANRIIDAAKETRNDFLSREEFKDAFSEKLLTDYDINDFESVHKFLLDASSKAEIDLGIKNIGYSAYKKNGIIAIAFNTQLFCTGTCSGTGDAYWYFYGVEEDKEIDYKTAAKKFASTFNEKSVDNYDNLPSEDCFEIEIDENNNMDISDEVAC